MNRRFAPKDKVSKKRSVIKKKTLYGKIEQRNHYAVINKIK